jgi:Septum formation
VIARPSSESDVEAAAGTTASSTQAPATTANQPPATITTATSLPQTSTTTQAVIAPEPMDAFAIAEGDCINLPDEELIETVDSVPCSSPHDAEAYALFDMAEGSATFPGVDSVDVTATDGCIERFLSFVGIPYAYSELDVFFFHPTEESWYELGDREVVCLITAMDGTKLTGSMEGSGAGQASAGATTDV